MEEKIKQFHPTVHKYLFTVTTFSKLLAMLLFILLPFAGFYLGFQYQKAILASNQIDNDTSAVSSKKTEDIVSNKYLLFKDTQAPTGEVVYQTEIPTDWTAHKEYESRASDGTLYKIGMGLYEIQLGPSHFNQYPENTSETMGMISNIQIFYSKDKSLIEKMAQQNSATSKQIVVDGTSATEFSNLDQGGLSTNIVFTKKDTTFWIVEPNGDGKGSKIYKQIISTFKVINGQLY